MTIPAYVINLPSASDRRAQMLKHLREHGLQDIRIFTGVLGAALSADERTREYDNVRAQATYGREFTAGEIGCGLSHLGVYQRMIDAGDNWAVVFEDDCQLRPGFLPVVESLSEWLRSTEPRVVLLSPLRGFLRRGAHHLDAEHQLVAIHRVWGAYAYALNRAAAEALLRANRPLWLMADDWIRYRKLTGLALHGVDPFQALPNELGAASHLAPERDASRAEAEDGVSTGRLQRRLAKLGRSLKEKLWLKPMYGLQRHQRPRSGF